MFRAKAVVTPRKEHGIYRELARGVSGCQPGGQRERMKVPTRKKHHTFKFALEVRADASRGVPSGQIIFATHLTYEIDPEGITFSPPRVVRVYVSFRRKTSVKNTRMFDDGGACVDFDESGRPLGVELLDLDPKGLPEFSRYIVSEAPAEILVGASTALQKGLSIEQGMDTGIRAIVDMIKHKAAKAEDVPDLMRRYATPRGSALWSTALA